MRRIQPKIFKQLVVEEWLDETGEWMELQTVHPSHIRVIPSLILGQQADSPMTKNNVVTSDRLAAISIQFLSNVIMEGWVYDQTRYQVAASNVVL